MSEKKDVTDSSNACLPGGGKPLFPVDGKRAARGLPYEPAVLPRGDGSYQALSTAYPVDPADRMPVLSELLTVRSRSY